jgi:hypothetical protein
VPELNAKETTVNQTHSPQGQAERRTGESEGFMTRDFEALHRGTSRDLPPAHEIVRRARAGATTREESLMSTLQGFVTRPLGAATVAAAALGFALLVIPVSFERTVGQQVRLALAGRPDPAAVERTANALAASLGTAEKRVMLGSRVGIEARARGCSRAEATRIAHAFVRELAGMGIPAEAAVEPWTEHATSNLYAYAATRLQDITVQIKGRTDAEIEKDVRDQLAGMGFSNPEVSFKREGGTAELKIQGKQDNEDIRAQIVAKIENGNGPASQMKMSLVDVSDLKGKTDAEIKAEVERRLKARGIDADVKVENGKVEVQAKHEIQR